MNHRTLTSREEPTRIEKFKSPSNKPTTLPRKRKKMRKSESKRLARLAVKMGGYENAAKSDAKAFTKPGSLK